MQKRDSQIILCFFCSFLIRFAALGALYPFSRNHNAQGTPSQEPYLWDSVADVSRRMLGYRYSLLHVFNTLFFRAHQSGGTVARPLFFNFPNDPNTWNIDSQFMIGNILLVSPVLTQGASNVTAYLPPLNDAGEKQVWYGWYSHMAEATGKVVLDARLDSNPLPIHISGGSILPLQHPSLSTALQAGNDFFLHVAPCARGNAHGELFMDDGEGLSVGSNALRSSFQYRNHTLTYTLDQSDYAPANKPSFTSVQIFAVNPQPYQVLLNGSPVRFTWQPLNYVVYLDYGADGGFLKLPLTQPFTIQLQWRT